MRYFRRNPLHTSQGIFLNRFFSDKPEEQSCCASATDLLKKSANMTGNTIYHGFDLTRIAFVTQSLLGRWLYQLFIELNRYDKAPSSTVQQTWLGWPIIATSLTMAIACKIYNYRKKEDNAAAQDYLFALFSSSMVYFILDTISSTGEVGSIHLAWFITSSILVPIASVLSVKLVIPDSSNKLIFKPNQFRDEENFPTYPEAKQAEKIINILAGVSYGAAISILAWTVNREINKETVANEIWQTLLIGGYYILSTYAGYKLTDHPKAFHAFTAVSKTIRDASFSYAAFSGIAFLLLMYQHSCGDAPCWDEDINMHLSWIFIPLSASLGLFSGLSTLFHYEYNHETNESYIGLASSAINKMVGCFKKLSCSKNDEEASMEDPYAEVAARYDIKLTKSWKESCCPRLFRQTHKLSHSDYLPIGGLSQGWNYP